MNKVVQKIILIFFTTILLTSASPIQPSKSNISEGFADLVTSLMPAVVNISTAQKSKKNQATTLDNLNQFLEQFMGPNQGSDEDLMEAKKLVSLGSGFIIDSEGYIVTNHHVIAESDEISVKLSGGTELMAKVIGVDNKTDLALLKIDAKKPLPFVKFGDSDKSRVGDWILAFGNPFGLGSTVTSGIISANGRDIASESIVDNFIQTDAAINRGNSGGPMFNMQGEVVGINTIILSPSGGNIGLGFATPSSIAVSVIEQLKANGKVKRGTLGIRMQEVTDEISESLGLDSKHGVLAIEVTKKSAAEKAGIAVGDVLVTFNGQQIKTARQFVKLISTSQLGQELEITLLRNGSKKTVKVILKEDKSNELIEPLDNELSPSDTKKEREKRFSQFSAKEVKGAYLAKLDTTLRDKFNIDSSVNGLIILSYQKRSVWHTKGFRPGDVIVSASQEQLDSIEKLEKILKSSKRKSVLLLINRGGTKIFVSLPIGIANLK